MKDLSVVVTIDQAFPSLARLAAAALKFDDARILAVRLRAERGELRCENGEIDEEGNKIGEPCWKKWISGVEDVTRLDRAEWCEPCLERQKTHEAYRLAVRARGAAARSLQQAAKAVRAKGGR